MGAAREIDKGAVEVLGHGQVRPWTVLVGIKPMKRRPSGAEAVTSGMAITEDRVFVHLKGIGETEGLKPVVA